MTEPLSLGVVARSRKPAERRLPIHPDHLGRVEADVRERMLLETGYGEQFGVSDDQLEPLVGRVCSRAELIAAADVVLLPKPQAGDLEDLREGQVLWGWPHCVQDRELTQVAIDRRLTLIAFEAMNSWTSERGFQRHVFAANNELAGYCSVLHALALTGATGQYGRPRSAVVIGSGATALGALTVLHALGITDVRVLSSRPVSSIDSPSGPVPVLRLDRDETAAERNHVRTDEGSEPVAPFLARSDIVVNCTLQDPNAPVTYVRTEDLDAFQPGSLIVDVSCDEGMGFSWARPTSFAEPMFEVGDHVRYYAVDHSPSYLWDSATWEISAALLPHLATVLAGPTGWEGNETISRAIEIRDGTIVNPAILEFQDRSPEYPHAPSA